MVFFEHKTVRFSQQIHEVCRKRSMHTFVPNNVTVCVFTVYKILSLTLNLLQNPTALFVY